MTSPPFMQMYWSDYFGDTRHLSCEQHGAYLQLLGSMWLAGGSLPNDDRKLAKITGCTASRWAKIRDDVMAFFEVAGDLITHKRVTFELEKAREKSIKRAEVGSRGGKAKALKTKETPLAIASDLLYHSPDIRTREEDKISEPKGSSWPILPKTSGFEDFWKAYPAKVGKRDAEKKFRLALQRAPLDRIMAGLDAAKRSKRWREGFIPNPATWLNQDRWADEPEGKSGPEPPAQPATPAVIAARLNHFRDTGEWRPSWGPIPTEVAA